MNRANGHRADFLLITALKEERDAVLKYLPSLKKQPPSDEDNRIYYAAEELLREDGGVTPYRVILMPIYGMGRVKAANATNDALRRWQPRYVVLVGIVGGLASKGVRLGDVLGSEQVVDYELQKLMPDGSEEVRWEVHQADTRLIGQAKDLDDRAWRKLQRVDAPSTGFVARAHFGNIASGDKVVALAKILEKYRESWRNLIGVEMEAGGVASACFQSPIKPGFFMIRGVSDLADESKDTARVEGWREYACDVAAAFTAALIEAMPITASESVRGTDESSKRDISHRPKDNVPPAIYLSRILSPPARETATKTTVWLSATGSSVFYIDSITIVHRPGMLRSIGSGAQPPDAEYQFTFRYDEEKTHPLNPGLRLDPNHREISFTLSLAPQGPIPSTGGGVLASLHYHTSDGRQGALLLQNAHPWGVKLASLVQTDVLLDWSEYKPQVRDRYGTVRTFDYVQVVTPSGITRSVNRAEESLLTYQGLRFPSFRIGRGQAIPTPAPGIENFEVRKELNELIMNEGKANAVIALLESNLEARDGLNDLYLGLDLCAGLPDAACYEALALKVPDQPWAWHALSVHHLIWPNELLAYLVTKFPNANHVNINYVATALTLQPRGLWVAALKALSRFDEDARYGLWLRRDQLTEEQRKELTDPDKSD